MIKLYEINVVIKKLSVQYSVSLLECTSKCTCCSSQASVGKGSSLVCIKIGMELEQDKLGCCRFCGGHTLVKHSLFECYC